MFTGIIESCVPVRALEPLGQGAELVLPLPSDGSQAWSVKTGQSIAVCGVCLTVADRRPVPPGGPEAPDDLVFHLSKETMERTWFGALRAGRPVNLERALCLGDRLDGHLVSGHVDGSGRVTCIQDVGDGGRVLTSEEDLYGETFVDGLTRAQRLLNLTSFPPELKAQYVPDPGAVLGYVEQWLSEPVGAGVLVIDSASQLPGCR